MYINVRNVLFWGSLLSILIGLLLSGSGSGSSLIALNGQDLELFRKTKDRGITKILQIILLCLFIFFVVFIIFSRIEGVFDFGFDNTAPPADESGGSDTAQTAAAIILQLV